MLEVLEVHGTRGGPPRSLHGEGGHLRLRADSVLHLFREALGMKWLRKQDGSVRVSCCCVVLLGEGGVPSYFQTTPSYPKFSKTQGKRQG